MNLKQTIMRQINERRKNIVARDILEEMRIRREIRDQERLPLEKRDTYYLIKLEKYNARLNSEIRRNERRIRSYNLI
jgi:hypothetical protein